MRAESSAEEYTASSLIPWRVVQVEPLPGFCLSVRFADGLSGLVDLSGLIHGSQAGVFSALADPDFFEQVELEHGAVTWPGGLDLAPDAMHDTIQRNGVWTL